MSDGGMVIGIDVAKVWLDVAVLDTGEVFRVDNDEAGWAELIERLKGKEVGDLCRH